MKVSCRLNALTASVGRWTDMEVIKEERGYLLHGESNPWSSSLQSHIVPPSHQSMKWPLETESVSGVQAFSLMFVAWLVCEDLDMMVSSVWNAAVVFLWNMKPI
jgi:hypothetical protein